MSVKTLARETEKFASFARDAAVVLLSSILLGLLGQIAIPLPFTPVPIVAQVHAVLLLAVLLGPRRAAAATFAFLVQGAMGLPVFAGGAAGIAALAGPTGGYLIGYLVAAVAVGAFIERWKERSIAKAAGAIALGNGIVYLFGAGYLATFVGFQKAVLLGVAPFLLGDAIKIFLCLKILQRLGWDGK